MTNDSGNYTCNATASPDPSSQFIVPVEGQLRMISITVGKTVLKLLCIPYCPEQAPMGACSSSAKILRWAVSQRTRLSGSTIPTQGFPLDAMLAAMRLNELALSVCPWSIEASPTAEKAVSCYKADRLIALLLSFCSVQSSLVVHEFRAAGENAPNEATDGCVWTFDAWCRVTQSASKLLQLSGPTFRFTTREFSNGGRLHREPWKTTKLSKLGGGRLATRVWALAQDNTVLWILRCRCFILFHSYESSQLT